MQWQYKDKDLQVSKIMESLCYLQKNMWQTTAISKKTMDKAKAIKFFELYININDYEVTTKIKQLAIFNIITGKPI
jgi:hypothetical protein